MTTYVMNTDAIIEIAGRIQQKHQEISGIVTELRSLNDELNSAWDGEAQMEFEVRFGDWLGQLEQFTGTLETVNQYLVTLVQARLDFEEQSKNAARGSV